jgi:AraC-like DNA-binding protein
MLTAVTPRAMKLYIKNMVSLRCILSVKAELEKLGIGYIEVALGEISLKEQVGPEVINKLEKALNAIDLYIIEDKKTVLVERIKQVIVEMIHNNTDDELPRENYSWYISGKLDHNYTYLANLFSQTEGITIEHYIIAHKIEKVKQLLMEGNLNLTQISYKLHYSSVAHLSSQFKKVTGMTPSQFRHIKQKG